MNFSRRGLLSRAWAPLIAASPLLLAARAMADDTAQYLYDPLGRLVRVTLSDGTIVIYKYDAAGNRTQAIRSDGSPFIQTLQVTGSGPVNLRAVADAAGYTGLTNATITFQVGSAVTILGAPGAAGGSVAGIGIDTGLWPSSTYAISLILQMSGKVYGGGGAGNSGGGGDAIYCREDIAITVNSGGQAKAGGGGGGEGGGWSTSSKDPETGEWQPYEYNGGGGGGGGFPNGPGAGGGAAGTPSGGGAGGAGHGTQRTWGAGGTGGVAAAAGGAGVASTGTGGCTAFACWQGPYPGSSGGPPGYAIRKNGKTVNVTNNGTIAGAVG